MTEWEKARCEDAKLAHAALMKFYPFELDAGLDGEIWREVAGYENYRVSNFGRVYSLYKNKILSPTIAQTGYLQFCLCKDHNKKTFCVHRLVAITFIDNPLNKLEVNHRDGHKLNNYVDNLEWATRVENAQHSWNMGLQKPQQGENRYNAKLVNVDVVYIRENPDSLNTYELAELFNMSQSSISEIQRGIKYKNVGGTLHENIPRPRVSAEKHDAILALRGQGYSQQEVADMFGVSQNTVHRFWNEK